MYQKITIFPISDIDQRCFTKFVEIGDFLNVEINSPTQQKKAPKYGNAETIFGCPKFVDSGSKNQIKLILDSDENTLEFCLLREEISFWKVQLPEKYRNLYLYPCVFLTNAGSSATFVDFD